MGVVPGQDERAESLLSRGPGVGIDAIQAELRRIASAYLRRERPNHTLQTTALVNEAYLRLARRGAWGLSDKAAFCAAAAQAVRRILTDHARGRRRQKRGGGHVRIGLTGCDAVDATPAPDVVELNDALERLKAKAPRAASIVELRYFGGMSEAEVADVLRVSRRTVQEDWRWARTWLMRDLA